MEIGDVVKIDYSDTPTFFRNTDDITQPMLVVRILEGDKVECCWVPEKGVVKYRVFDQDKLEVYDLDD